MCLAVCCCTRGSAQGTPRGILVRTVARGDWDLRNLAAVRFGQLALVTTATGSSLEVRRLQQEAPLPPPRLVRSVAPEFAGSNLLVADFAHSNRTPLGGYYNTFVQPPSLAAASVGPAPDGRRSLQLMCRRRDSGFCGLWIQLYDFDAPPEARSYLDARSFTTLSFWIRGRRGGERLLLKVADADWELREDAVPLAEVTQFLATGQVDTAWQQAVVPLDRFPSNLRRQTLALLVFEALQPGTTAVDLGPVAFSRAPTGLPPLPEPQGTQPARPPNKATWIWNTAELLEDAEQQAALLAFLQRERFDHVFLQLPGVPGRRGAPGEVAIDAASLRPLVAALNHLDIRVYALDGDPHYALPRFHAGVLGTVENVIRYNRQVREEERFFGVRYDIEPYILPGFNGPRRELLLEGLLQLTAASVARAHAAGLKYGADIPFWYDAPAEYTYEHVTAEFGGVRKPASEHIIDLVDNVSIMDYRTVAYGADGTVRHASGELEYAQRRGKRVFVGLETAELPDEVLLDFRGDPRRGLAQAAPAGEFVVLAAAADSVYVLHVAERAELDSSALAELEQHLAERGLEASEVWWWPISRRVNVPADKVTFARHDARQLETVLEQTATAFQRYTSFAGFALHFAQSYRDLLADPDRAR